jgi:N-acetylglucosaminyldiphosphoundecaprenol N-acetyl-beta-D-mannosaminyltransferase
LELDFEDIVGYRVATDSVEALVAEVMRYCAAGERRCRYFACLNPHAVEVAAGEPDFEAALQGADFLTPDGIGVVYASRARGGRIRRRVTGMDIFEGVSRAMNGAGGGSCFFLGSTTETLEAIRARMNRDFPSVRVAGVYSPPFRPEFTAEDNDRMIEAVNASGADVLWVGLTAPKQERWIHRHRDRLAVNFAGPIGAAFDFYVGNIKRAGPVWQDLGLEWLPRLLQEPRRLWRRSLVSAPRFFYRALMYRGNNNMS